MSKTNTAVWRSRRCVDGRRGTAAMEAAVCLPLVVFLMLSSIEAATMVYLDHTLSVAAYEGARVAVRTNGTNSDMVARCNAILNERAVVDATVTVNPSDISQVAGGTALVVTVSAPCEANSFLPGVYFYGGKTLTATCTMVKE